MTRLEELIERLCPDGVEYRTLGELGNFFGGITGKAKDDFVNGNAKFITYKNVYTNPALQLDVEDRVRIADDEKQPTLQYGDVIFTGSSETPDECGISSVLATPTREALYLNSFCFFFRFDDPKIMLPDFSKHLFRSGNLRYQIGKTASGVTRYNVSKKLMAKIIIPVPPLEVQQEIVRILDQFTQLTAELNAELDAELNARKHQYEYYLNQILEFEDVPIWVELGTVTKSVTTGLNPRRFFKLNTDDASNYYVTIRELQNNSVVFSEKTDRINDEALRLCNNRSNLEIGDILFSGTGTIGETAVIKKTPTNWNIKEGVYSIKPLPEKLNSRFLMYLLHTNKIRSEIFKKVAGGTVKSIPMGELRKLKIPVPPMSEQERLVNLIDHFDAVFNDLTSGLPAEIAARQKQYEYYRDKLLTFPQKN